MTCYHDRSVGAGATIIHGSLVGLIDGALAARPEAAV